ncbi:hypothetical protein RBU60_00530 [Mesonia sp. MT50]|uniref:Outer membrane protein beta-barrel domain-containing protein n=1 Tax=Mesonia profundi TaxID=3070998 RepID=A0ABU0ZXD2_9FLAO|nr:DUF6588 family protein [Mesonia profundi]MDQ7916049.1 hypothetical protein [Mesonia profundi]
MKKLILIICILAGAQLSAQNSIQELLNAGVDDAQTFMSSYFKPGAAGALYAANSGWYNSAKAKKFLGFEISIVGNMSFVGDDQKSFILDVDDYNNIRLPSGQNQIEVATVFGVNHPDATVLINYIMPNGSTETVEIELPQGAINQTLDAVPAAFLQGSVGLFKGFEVKARFAPKVKYDEVSAGLYGAALQYEITSLLPADKLFPVAVSALIGYTHFDASYDLDHTSIQAADPNINTSMSSFNFSAIASTNLPIINFYGGLNYMTGNAKTNLDGEYTFTEGALQGQTIKDPLRIENSVDGVSATLGFKLKLAFIGLNASYSFQEYDAVSVGLNFGL